MLPPGTVRERFHVRAIRLLVGLALCVSAGASVAAQAVAEVGARRVSAEEFREALARVRASGDAAATVRTMTEEGRREVLDRIVARELYALAGRERKLDEDPEVRAALDRATAEILAARFVQLESAAADVSEPVLRRWYDAHLAEFQAPPRVRARHILLTTRAEAEAVRAEVASGGDFQGLARQRSVDPHTRAKGGELGWVAAGVMVPAFEKALFALKPGEIGPVVESTHGFHVIRADAVEPGATLAFDSVKAEIRERVVQEHLERVKARLQEQFPVRIHRIPQ